MRFAKQFFEISENESKFFHFAMNSYNFIRNHRIPNPSLVWGLRRTNRVKKKSHTANRINSHILKSFTGYVLHKLPLKTNEKPRYQQTDALLFWFEYFNFKLTCHPYTDDVNSLFSRDYFLMSNRFNVFGAHLKKMQFCRRIHSHNMVISSVANYISLDRPTFKAITVSHN